MLGFIQLPWAAAASLAAHIRTFKEVYTLLNLHIWGFPGGVVVKNLPANAGDRGLSPGPGRSHMPGTTKPVCHNY